MPRYTVNATLTAPAWVSVVADTPEAALAEAKEMAARDFDCDMAEAFVDFNVTPVVDPES